MDVRTRTRRRNKRWDGDIQGLEPLGHGVSGMVFGIDKRRVAKIDIGTERSIADIEIEREVYRRVKRDPDPCPYVLQCYENDNPSGLVLERCNETVRIRLRAHYKTGAPISIAKKWAYEAARGLAHIHRAGIVQGDVGCHNMLLDHHDTVKLADFAGSSIDGIPSTVDYDIRSKLPGNDNADEISDIFALGSAMWEMAMGTLPYPDLSWREVQGLYKRGKFPKPKNMSELGRIITNCWQQFYSRAEDVVADLEYAFPELISTEYQSESEESLLETIPSHGGRGHASKYTYVEKATNHRHKTPKYKDSEKRNENDSRKEKQKGRGTVRTGFLLKWFTPTHTRAVKV